MAESRSLVTRHLQIFATQGDQQVLSVSRAMRDADRARARQQRELADAYRKVSAQVARDSQASATAAKKAADAAAREAAAKSRAAAEAAAGARKAADAEVRAAQRAASAGTKEARQRLTAARQVAQAQARSAAAARQDAAMAERAATQKIRASERAARAATRASREEMTASQRAATAATRAAREEVQASQQIVGAQARQARATRRAAAAGPGGVAAELRGGASHGLQGANAVATTAGAGAVFGIAALARGAMDYERQMSKVQAVSGATNAELREMDQLAKDLGAKTSYSAGESAMALGELAKAGFTARQSMATLPGTIDLAAASGVGLAEAATIQSDALRGFGLDSKDATRVADVFSVAVNRSSIEMSDLGYTLKYMAPIASTTGQSFEDMTAAVAILGNVGIRADTAGTTLRTMMVNLVKPTEGAEEALKSLGTSSKELQGPDGLKPLPDIIGKLVAGAEKLPKAERLRALTRIFGKESLSGISALVDKGAPSLRKLSDEMLNADGSADRMARTMQDNVAMQVEQVTGSIETLGLTVFSKFAPQLQSGAERASKAIADFTANEDNIQDITGTIGDVAGVIGGVVEAGVPLVKFARDAVGWFSDLPEPLRDSVLQAGLLYVVAKKLAGTAAIGGIVSMLGQLRGGLRATSVEARTTSLSLQGIGAAGIGAPAGAGGAAALGTASLGSGGRGAARAPAAAARGAGALSAVPVAAAMVAGIKSALEKAVNSMRGQVQQAASDSGTDIVGEASSAMSEALGGGGSGGSDAAEQQASRRRQAMRGAAGVVAGGVASAMSGGDVATGAVSGAALGAMAGPVGAAAGALAGGGVTAIVNAFKGASAKRAAKAAREFAKGAAGETDRALQSGLRREPAQRLGRANAVLIAGKKAREEMAAAALAEKSGDVEGLKRAGDLRRSARSRAKGAGIDLDALLKNDSNAYKKAGREAAAAFGQGLQTIKRADATGLFKQFRAALGNAPKDAQFAGAAAAVRFAQGLERSGGAPKGTAKRLAGAIEAEFGDLAGAAGRRAKDTTTALTRGLQSDRAVRAARKTVEGVVDAMSGFEEIPRIAVRSVPGAVAALRTQLDHLRDVVKDKDASKAMRDQARRSLPALRTQYRRTLEQMAGDMGMSKKEAGGWAREVSRAARRAGDGSIDVDRLKDSVSQLNTRMANGKDVARSVAAAWREAGSSARDAKAAGDAAGAAVGTLGDWGSALLGGMPGGRTGGRFTGTSFVRYRAGGLVPALVSSGERIDYGNRSMIVPGPRVAADNVAMMLPAGAQVFTDHGQQLLEAGASRSQALAEQLPHFATGGIVTAAKAGRAAGWTGNKLVTGVAIAGPESGYRLRARLANSREDSRGFWQINTLAHPWARSLNLYDPYVAAKAADRVYRQAGNSWAPWAGYTGPDGRGSDGAWRQFVPQARRAVIATRGAAGRSGSSDDEDTQTRRSGRTTTTTKTTDDLRGLSERNARRQLWRMKQPAVGDAFSQGLAAGRAGETRLRYVGTLMDEVRAAARVNLETETTTSTRAKKATARSSSAPTGVRPRSRGG